MEARPRVTSDDFSAFIRQLYRMFKTGSIHLMNNEAVTQQLQRSVAAVQAIADEGHDELHVLFLNDTVFVNGTLLKASRDVYEAALELAALLGRAAVNQFSVTSDVTYEGLYDVVAYVSESLRRGRAPERLPAFSPAATLRYVDPELLEDARSAEMSAEDRVGRSYASTLVVMRFLFDGLKRGHYAVSRQLKRLAQQLVLVAEDEPDAFLAVTRMREVRDDEAGRAVNSAILAILAGRQLTDDVRTLGRLALSALLADVGRPRAAEMGQAPGELAVIPRLSDQQRARMPAATAAALAVLGRLHDESLHRTVVGFEAQHLAHRGVAAPLYGGLWHPRLESTLVCVVRRFNDLLTFDVQAQARMSPDAAIAAMRASAEDAEELFCVDLLFQALGLIPRGSVVEMASGFVGVVVANSEKPGLYGLPTVQLFEDAEGARIAAVSLNLSQPDAHVLRHGGIEAVLPDRTAPSDLPQPARTHDPARRAESAHPPRPARLPPTTSTVTTDRDSDTLDDDILVEFDDSAIPRMSTSRQVQIDDDIATDVDSALDVITGGHRAVQRTPSGLVPTIDDSASRQAALNTGQNPDAGKTLIGYAAGSPAPGQPAFPGYEGDGVERLDASLLVDEDDEPDEFQRPSPRDATPVAPPQATLQAEAPVAPSDGLLSDPFEVPEPEPQAPKLPEPEAPEPEARAREPRLKPAAPAAPKLDPDATDPNLDARSTELAATVSTSEPIPTSTEASAVLDDMLASFYGSASAPSGGDVERAAHAEHSLRGSGGPAVHAPAETGPLPSVEQTAEYRARTAEEVLEAYFPDASRRRNANDTLVDGLPDAQDILDEHLGLRDAATPSGEAIAVPDTIDHNEPLVPPAEDQAHAAAAPGASASEPATPKAAPSPRDGAPAADKPTPAQTDALLRAYLTGESPAVPDAAAQAAPTSPEPAPSVSAPERKNSRTTVLSETEALLAAYLTESPPAPSPPPEPKPRRRKRRRAAVVERTSGLSVSGEARRFGHHLSASGNRPALRSDSGGQFPFASRSGSGPFNELRVPDATGSERSTVVSRSGPQMQAEPAPSPAQAPAQPPAEPPVAERVSQSDFRWDEDIESPGHQLFDREFATSADAQLTDAATPEPALDPALKTGELFASQIEAERLVAESVSGANSAATFDDDDDLFAVSATGDASLASGSHPRASSPAPPVAAPASPLRVAGGGATMEVSAEQSAQLFKEFGFDDDAPAQRTARGVPTVDNEVVEDQAADEEVMDTIEVGTDTIELQGDHATNVLREYLVSRGAAPVEAHAPTPPPRREPAPADSSRGRGRENPPSDEEDTRQTHRRQADGLLSRYVDDAPPAAASRAGGRDPIAESGQTREVASSQADDLLARYFSDD